MLLLLLPVLVGYAMLHDICYHWYYRYYHDIGEEWYLYNDVVVVLLACYDLSESEFWVDGGHDIISYRTLFCIINEQPPHSCTSIFDIWRGCG